MEIAALVIAIIALVIGTRRNEELKLSIRMLEEDLAKLVDEVNAMPTSRDISKDD